MSSFRIQQQLIPTTGLLLSTIWQAFEYLTACLQNESALGYFFSLIDDQISGQQFNLHSLVSVKSADCLCALPFL
jgi:hypothetical protein